MALATPLVADEELVYQTLKGLPDVFKTTIRNRPGSITVSELSSLLSSEAIHVESVHRVPTEQLTLALQPQEEAIHLNQMCLVIETIVPILFFLGSAFAHQSVSHRTCCSCLCFKKPHE